MDFKEFIEFVYEKILGDAKNSESRDLPPSFRFSLDHISENLFWHEAKIWLDPQHAINFLALVERDAFRLRDADGKPIRRQYQSAVSYLTESGESAMEITIRVHERLTIDRDEREIIRKTTADAGGVSFTAVMPKRPREDKCQS